jgi:hypothetical protein
MANQISVSLDTTQKVLIHTAPNGTLAGPLVWSIVSGDATVADNGDGTAFIVSGSTAGAVVASVTDGSISGEIDATITAAVVAATDLGLTADAPVAK